MAAMRKLTVYLPNELSARLATEATVSGVSKAELIRRGIVALLGMPDRPERSTSLPVFDSRRPRTPEQLDDELLAEVRSKVARR